MARARSSSNAVCFRVRTNGGLLVVWLLAGCTRAPWVGDDAGLKVMSFNLANGAGDSYRTDATRVAQARFLADAGVSIVAFQEVDMGTERVAKVATALDVAQKFVGSFAGCSGNVRAVDLSADGTWTCATDGGALVFGKSFSGDSLCCRDKNGMPGGIRDGDSTLNPTGTDKGADAFYGNALLVLPPAQLVEAFTVALPREPHVDAGALPASLFVPPLSAGSRAALGAFNDVTRSEDGSEPRTCLVARLARPGHVPLTVMALHLAAGGSAAPLRLRQLEAVASLARSERASVPTRHVVVLGDFNASFAVVAPFLEDAGLRGYGEVSSIDQVWTDEAAVVEGRGLVETLGASDHRHAPVAIIR